MKKSLLIGLLGLSLNVASSFGQGTIFLDNYFTSGPDVRYGTPGIPANGFGGAQGTPGTGLLAGWSMGFYYALGDVRGSIVPDPTGMLIPSGLGSALVLATGAGSTAEFFTSSFGTAGEGFSSSFFGVPGTAAAGGNTITMMVVAYAGSDYATAGSRGHSDAFVMTTSASTSSNPNQVGNYMPAFSVNAPEPSSFALMGMSGIAWLIVRRRKLNS
jgi:hypothetical protein